MAAPHYVSVKAHKRGAAKRLHHLELHHGADGGHEVQHHHSSGHPMEKHQFGPGEGHMALEHMAQHMGVQHGGVAPAEEAQESPQFEAGEQEGMQEGE